MGSQDLRLRKMVGQLLLSGFQGKRAADPGVAQITAALREGRLSGVYVRGSNISNGRQLKALLQHMVRAGSESPALIAIDQPGGPDAVLSEEKSFAIYSAAGTVGSAVPPYQAQLLYRDMARELASIGINLNIGPSADPCNEAGINLSGDCFGPNPASATAFARAFSFGHHDKRVLAALRRTVHAPSQTGVSPSLAILQGVVKGEVSDAIVVRMKTAELLALTEPHLGPIQLRDMIQNAGSKDTLIIELDADGDGAPVRYGDAIVQAIRAGADMILLKYPELLPGNFYELSLNAIRMGLETGGLSLARIEEAYGRVARLKRELGTKAVHVEAQL
jgi:beta-N-acetylhexosaminidase